MKRLPILLVTVLLVVFAAWLIARDPFSSFQSGMSMREVERAVGSPQAIRTNENGIVLWDYTSWLRSRTTIFFGTNGLAYRRYSP